MKIPITTSRAKQGVDETLSNDLLHFIRTIVTLRQTIVLYGKGNASVKEAQEHWKKAAQSIFEKMEIIEITAAARNLFVGDVLLDQKSGFVRELVENLRRLIIRRLSLKRGIEDEELNALMEMLSLDTRELLLKGGPTAFLTERGVQNVQVLENIYMKRMELVGQGELETTKLNIEDLRSIKRQLKKFISMRGEGFELNGQERELLAETGKYPTFMGELIKETSGAEKEAGDPAERMAAAERVSRNLDTLYDEMHKVRDFEEDSFNSSLSKAMLQFDEKMRMEIMAEQFDHAGLLAPLLERETLQCKVEPLAELIVEHHALDPARLDHLFPLLSKIIKTNELLKKTIDSVRNLCKKNKSDAAPIIKKLEKEIGDYLKKPPEPPSLSGDDAALKLQESLRQLLTIKKVDLDPAKMSSFLTAGAPESRETVILAHLLRTVESSGKLTKKAALRARALIRSGHAQEAHLLLTSLKKPPGVKDDAPGNETYKRIRSLCEDGTLRSFLDSDAESDSKALILSDILHLLPAEDGSRLLQSLMEGDANEINAILPQVGRTASETFLRLFQSYLREGNVAKLVGSLTMLEHIVPEKTVPLLKELCARREPELKLRAASLLSKLSPGDAKPFLLTMIEDADGEVRKRAIHLIGHFGLKEAQAKLIAIASRQSGKRDVEERTLACRALAACGDEKAVPPLVAILKTEGRGARTNDQLITAVRFALESIDSPAARSALKQKTLSKRLSFFRFFKRD
jgi:hypothetical protein